MDKDAAERNNKETQHTKIRQELVKMCKTQEKNLIFTSFLGCILTAENSKASKHKQFERPRVAFTTRC